MGWIDFIASAVDDGSVVVDDFDIDGDDDDVRMACNGLISSGLGKKVRIESSNGSMPLHRRDAPHKVGTILLAKQHRRSADRIS